MAATTAITLNTAITICAFEWRSPAPCEQSASAPGG